MVAETPNSNLPPTSSAPTAQSEDAEGPINPYQTACAKFCGRMSAFHDTSPWIFHVLGMVMHAGQAKLDHFKERHSKSHPTDNNKFTVPVSLSSLYDRLGKEVDGVAMTVLQLPRIIFVAMVSEYDALLGRLIGGILRDRPEILNASGKQLTFAQLLNFGDLESARKFLIEKEVESVLRDSHADHFKWLENRLGIPLTEGLDAFPKFIEITERRNLFVHTDGHVSSQYLENCRKHGAPLTPNLQVGQELLVMPDYLRESEAVLMEIGVKLSQVLWRKLRPKEIEDAEADLTRIAYELIAEGRHQIAINILDFFVRKLKWEDEERQLMCTINLAQALKWTKKSDKALQLISNLGSGRTLGLRFQMALAVLRDDFESAAKIMQKIGTEDEAISREAYRDWPLFKEFRKQGCFLRSFQDVFGISFDEYSAESKVVQDELQKRGSDAIKEYRDKTNEAGKEKEKDRDPPKALETDKDPPPTGGEKPAT